MLVSIHNNLEQNLIALEQKKKLAAACSQSLLINARNISTRDFGSQI